MTTVSLDDRIGTLAIEVRAFRDEIRNHYATKADLEKAKWQLGALVIGSVGVATTIIALIVRLWT